MSDSLSHINPLLLSAAISDTTSEINPTQQTASTLPPSTTPSAETHSLAPPPELSYATRTELDDAAQRWALEHGYAIKKTNTTSWNGEDRGTYKCDRSGQPDEPNPDKLGKSKKIGCPFEFLGNFYKKQGCYRIKIKNPHHNHPASADPYIHPIHRRLTSSQKEKVTELTNAGVAPLKIKSALVQDTNTPSHATLNTIYNHRNQMRMDQLQGRTPIEALVNQIRDHHFYFMIDSSEGHMTSFFFAHPRSLELVKRFPTTILLDCTYKTNKYNMPLLHIVGMNSCNRSFSVAFCFLSAEKEPNYTWALEHLHLAMDKESPSVIVTDHEQAVINAIKKVYPNANRILCSWHIWKNIEKNCRKHFKSEEKWETFHSAWKKLRLSPTLKEFEENYAELSKLWNPETAAYLISVVLPLKEHFVAYLIDRHPHFGNHITSRVESLHAYLKRFINSSTGSFSAVVKQINQSLESQLHERYIESAQHQYKRLTGLPPMIANLNGIISHFALRIVFAFHMAKAPTTTCTGNYSAHMGIPCIHQVHNAKLEGSKFTADDFHAQWHVKMDLDVST
jgi:hypothetical protein